MYKLRFIVGSGLFVLSLACWFLFWLRLLGTVTMIQRREMGRGIHSGIEALDVSFFVYHYFNRQYFFLSLRCIYVIVFISVRIPFPINNCISLDLSLVLVCLFCLWLVDFYFGFACWGRWRWYREERWDEGFTAESRPLEVSFFVYHYFNLSLRCIYVIVFICVRIPFQINNCISLDLSLNHKKIQKFLGPFHFLGQ